jgi:hypothetical protein
MSFWDNFAGGVADTMDAKAIGNAINLKNARDDYDEALGSNTDEAMQKELADYDAKFGRGQAIPANGEGGHVSLDNPNPGVHRTAAAAPTPGKDVGQTYPVTDPAVNGGATPPGAKPGDPLTVQNMPRSAPGPTQRVAAGEADMPPGISYAIPDNAFQGAPASQPAPADKAPASDAAQAEPRKAIDPDKQPAQAASPEMKQPATYDSGWKMSERAQYELGRQEIQDRYKEAQLKAQAAFFKRRGDDVGSWQIEKKLEDLKFGRTLKTDYFKLMDGDPGTISKIAKFMNISLTQDGQKIVPNGNGGLAVIDQQGNVLNGNFQPTQDQLNRAWYTYAAARQFSRDADWEEFHSKQATAASEQRAEDKDREAIAKSRDTRLIERDKLSETIRHNKAEEADDARRTSAIASYYSNKGAGGSGGAGGAGKGFKVQNLQDGSPAVALYDGNPIYTIQTSEDGTVRKVPIGWSASDDAALSELSKKYGATPFIYQNPSTFEVQYGVQINGKNYVAEDLKDLMYGRAVTKEEQEKAAAAEAARKSNSKKIDKRAKAIKDKSGIDPDRLAKEENGN